MIRYTKILHVILATFVTTFVHAQVNKEHIYDSLLLVRAAKYQYSNIEITDSNAKFVALGIDTNRKIDSYLLLAQTRILSCSFELADLYMDTAENLIINIPNYDSTPVYWKLLNIKGECYKYKAFILGDDTKNVDSAKKFYLAVRNNRVKSSNPWHNRLVVMALNNLAEVALFENNYKSILKARDYVDSAINICSLNLETSNKNKSKTNQKNNGIVWVRYLGYLYETYGDYFNKINDSKNAFIYYKKSDSTRTADTTQKNTYEFYLSKFALALFLNNHNDFKRNDSIKYLEYLEKANQFSPYYSRVYLSKLFDSERNLVQRESSVKEKNKWLIFLVFLTLGGLLGIAIFLYKLIKQNKEIDQLDVIGKQIIKATTARDISSFIDYIYDEINNLVEAPIIIISLFNNKSNLLTPYIKEKGLSFRIMEPRNVSTYESEYEKGVGKDPQIECFITQKELYIPNYEKSEFQKAKANEGKTPNFVAVLPLTLESNKIGIFSIQNFNKKRLKSKILRNISYKLAIALSDFNTRNENYELLLDVETRITAIKEDFLNLPLQINLYLEKVINSELGIDSENSEILLNARNQITILSELLNSFILHNDKRYDVPIIMEKINSRYLLESIVLPEIKRIKKYNIELEFVHQGLEYTELNKIEGVEFISDKRVLIFVLNAILNNAIDSITEKKSFDEINRIRIFFSVSNNGTLEIAIADNGIGMTLSDAQNFFSEEKFIKRLKVSQNMNKNGVSLKMCYSLINIYNLQFENLFTEIIDDYLTVETSGEQKGCMFILKLPIKLKSFILE